MERLREKKLERSRSREKELSARGRSRDSSRGALSDRDNYSSSKTDKFKGYIGADLGLAMPG